MAIRDYAAILQDIWTRALGDDVKDRDVNFFELGGTSLKMMRIHAELQKNVELEVSIVELFAHPTINAMAGRLAELEKERSVPPDEKEKRPLGRMFRPIRLGS